MRAGTYCECVAGKRMLADDNCEDPRCQDCQDGEYQSGYTSKNKCERQPSCDTSECPQFKVTAEILEKKSNEDHM